MSEGLQPIPLAFWRSAAGQEPVRDWLKNYPVRTSEPLAATLPKYNSVGRLDFRCVARWAAVFGRSVRRCRANAKRVCFSGFTKVC